MDPKPNSIDGAEFAMIAFIAMMVAGVIYACYWLFQIPLSVDGAMTVFDQRLERVSRIGLLMVGVIGFPLAIWRSVLSFKQTKEAITQGRRVERQMAATERQIIASEENNLASILEKATSLLADNSHVRQQAGLAMLHYIASDKKRAFATEAILLLSNFVEDEILLDHANNPVFRAVQYLKQLTKVHGALTARFKMIDRPAYFIAGLSGIRFTNCRFFLEDALFQMETCSFEDCTFDYCVVGPSQSIVHTAKFERCNIVGLKTDDIFENIILEFKECDFSGCGTFPIRSTVHLEDCFYSNENPPSQLVMHYFSHNMAALTAEEAASRIKIKNWS